MPDLNPLDWLGGQVQQAATNFWILAMAAIWGAGQYLLKEAFAIEDRLAAPPLTADGPLADVLGITLWLGITLATIMTIVQLCLAMVRRDGQALGRLVLGLGQFAFVCAAFITVGATVVTGADQLAHGLLKSLLNVDTLSSWNPVPQGIGRNVTDATAATVLGLTSLFLLIPGAFMNLVICLVKNATLMVLLATTPITAGGLLSDVGKPWFWKQLRWFLCCALISPSTALVLGIGESISKGVVTGQPQDTLSSIGTAVVAVVLVAVGCVCPLALFRLFAWIDPATPSGAALRQSWTDAGGFAGVAGGRVGGSSEAIQEDGTGRAQGEAGADSQTGSRWSSALGSFGQGAAGGGRGLLGLGSTSMAYRAVDVATDVLGAAGVGHPAYTLTYSDERAQRLRDRRGSGDDGGDDGAGTGGPAAPPPGPDAPHPPGGGATPGGAGGTGGPAGGGAAGAGGGSGLAGAAEAGAVVAG